MDLLRHMIEKEIETYQAYSVKKYTIRSIWKFYQAVNLSLSVLKQKGIKVLNRGQIRQRNKIYSKLLMKRQLTTKEQQLFDSFLISDMEIVTRALSLIQDIKLESQKRVINFEKDKFIGILAREVHQIL